MSRDTAEKAVDDARTGNMSSYNALPLKDCTPTSGHQIWQPNVKGGEAVCLAHQSRCKITWGVVDLPWNSETITKNAGDMSVHDAVDDARNGNMSSYNALPINDCTPTSGHQIWQPNVKDGEAVCIAHQSRCKINWNAETITKNAVGMIIRDGGPSSPPSDIFMAEHGKNSYFNKEHDCYQCGKCHTAFDDENAANYCCTACYACGYADHVGFERAQKCCPCNCAETGGGPNGTCQDTFSADDPTQASASNLGGPTAPGNAGVPSDVGGDDLVPYDSPSAPPAGVFMNAEYKNVKSQPFKHLVLGVAFTVSTLYFWSTAGGYVKNQIVVRVQKYAPQLLNPQFQVILTTLSLVGIIYFGRKLYGATRGLDVDFSKLHPRADIVLPDVLDLDF